MPAAVEVEGALNLAALEASFHEIVRRHQVLRARFSSPTGEVEQAVGPESPFVLPVIDLGALPEKAREALTRQLALENAARPFDLAARPPLRVAVVRQELGKYRALVNLHQIACDDRSLAILLHEIGALYEAFAAGRPSPLPHLPAQYSDYAAWQRQWMAGEVLAAQVVYWREHLAGAPVVLDLPTDRPRPVFQTSVGRVERFTLPARLARSLRELGRGSDATLFMVLLAAWQLLLFRISGQQRLLVGSPVAGRRRKEHEGLIGWFTNTLVLRLDIFAEMSFIDALTRARETVLGAYAHQDLPFEKLVEELQPERDLSRSPLIQALVVLQQAPPQLELAGLKCSPLAQETGAVRYDLSLVLVDTESEIAGQIEFNTDLFDVYRIQRLAGHWRALLDAMSAEPGRCVSEVSLLSAAERQQAIFEWNDTGAAYPQERCLHELFEAQTDRKPEVEAVRCGKSSLTYSELERRSNRLAHELRALGVGPEVVVGVYLERSLEMVVALLGTLKAGGAYLPLDPSYPEERVAFFVADAAPTVVLTVSALSTRVPAGCRIVVLDRQEEAFDGESQDRLPATAGPDNLAYVIYTSGSTGRPKGATNTHRGIVNRILWMQATYGLSSEDRVLQKTPFSFDVSVWELFWPVAVGACLVMALPEGHRDPAYLSAVISAEGITTLHFVPSMLRVFLDAEGLAGCDSVRRLMASGEELTSDLVAVLIDRLPGCDLHNLYGPTEAAVDVTSWHCQPTSLEVRDPESSRSSSKVSIGRPIANLQIHLFDQTGEIVPPGTPGELCIGGIGVGRGYLARPELTAERFVPDPYSLLPGGRLYRTGDLAAHRVDGKLDFLGRIDHQVKIRGQRLELGEIEAALAALPTVSSAVVIACEYGLGDRRLVAFCVPAYDRELSPGLLREALRLSLPEGFIPSLFMALPEMPLTPSGKVDRRVLEKHLSAGGDFAPHSYAPAVTAVEQAVASLWSDLLGTDRVGLNDSFFELGGHSLLASRLVSRMRESLGVDLPLRLIFAAPILGHLAEAVLQCQLEQRGAAGIEP